MNLKYLSLAVFINFFLAIWPIVAKKSGLPGSVVNLLSYTGGVTFATAIWWFSPTRMTVLIHPGWSLVIVAMGLMTGFCMYLYTSVIMKPEVPAGIFMLTSALLYACFAPILDWMISGSKLSPKQVVGMFLSLAAMYCLSGKK